MRRTALALAAIALLATSAGTAVAEPQQLRIGLVVGNNVGNEAARALKYAETEVGRLAGLLRGAGDFDSLDVLRGKGRAEVEGALKTVRARLEAARNAGRPTLFLFYYSGHGDNEALELGQSRLPLRDLKTYIENMPADVKLAFVDACQSGALTGVKSTVKGGRRAPAYEVRLADPGQVKGMAIITSSTANELSQESDDLQGSFFSQNVMDGLRGAADSSGDDQVTLNELYQYTFKRTLANTAASLIGGQHPTFDYRLLGAGDVVLTRVKPGDARLRFPRETGVTYTVMKGAGDASEVVAELAASPSDEMYISLPAGQYRVVRRSLASVTEQRYTLKAGSADAVKPATMVAVAWDNTKRKKGGRLAEANLFGVGAGAQSSVVPGAGVVAAFGLAYTRELANFSLRLRGEVSSFNATNAGFTSENLRGLLAMDALVPLVDADRFTLLAGPSIGVPVVRQRIDNVSPNTAVNITYGAVLASAVRVAPRTWLTLSLFGGGETYKVVAKATHKHRPVGGGAIGGAFAF